ncbi:MAG: sulfatase-like hydrolase/transferase [Myxococcales bacterium]|nr:sulfatase-like hydrolase/transferase [Myxococcales bacterium]MDH5565609.1 sulfatase-like hydrolase/transferase [Myxococcales bacterium]
MKHRRSSGLPLRSTAFGRQRSRGSGAVLLLLIAAGSRLLACADRPPPNLLLIVSDTLRADALACQGGAAITPNICALAERGVLFENAYSNASWTLPSSVAMFTGNHPSEYARRQEEAAGSGDPIGKWFFYVDASERMCAEALVERGYEAVGFLENGVPLEANVLQGFSALSVDAADGEAPDLEELAARTGLDAAEPRDRRLAPALRYLLSAGSRPFVLLEWLEDPHAVYDPPPRQMAELDLDPGRLAHPIEFYTRLGSRADAERGVLPLKRYAPRMSLYERVALKRLYLAEVASVDERVGLLLRALELGGLRDDTLIVFTSDHGEGFGEHGLYLHANSFYGELVHVPLIVAGPGITAGKRVAEPVSHVDLMPTLRELLGVDCLREDARGRSFRSLLTSAESQEQREQYLVDARPESGDALIRGNHKLVSQPSGKELLFDLSSDPEETRDLAEHRTEVTQAMRDRLNEIRWENAERRKANLALLGDSHLEDVGEKTLEQLRAIGYLE